MSLNLRKGLRYENEARQYLEDCGLDWIESNYRCRFGEIDLVMIDRDSLCFIEVKFRHSMRFGGAASAISQAKQRKISKSAQNYLVQHSRYASCAMRFDALLIQRQADGNNQFNWIQNAFYGE